MEGKISKNKKTNKECLNTFNKKGKIPKFSQLCRVCLRQTKETDRKLDTRIVLLNNSQEIKNLLEESTGVQIGHLDLLPNHICSFCLKTLTKWYQFRSQTKFSHEIFKKFLIKLGTSSEVLPNADLTIHWHDQKLHLVPAENVAQIDDFQISVVQDEPVVVGFVLYCDSCEMKFTNQISLDNHLEEHCKPLSKKAYKCELCLKSFTFQNRLQKHMKLSHRRRNARHNYHCDVCRRHYNTPTALKIHKTKACIPMDLREQCKIKKCDISQAEMAAIADKTIRETKVPCSLCKEVFKSRVDFVGHLPKHKNQEKCHICQKVFSCPRFLESHVRVHLRLKVYPCPMCTRSFYTIGAFRSHMKEHGQGEWVHRCTICQKEFSTVGEFDNHILKHLEDEKIGKQFNHKIENENDQTLAIVKEELDASMNSESKAAFKLEVDLSADPTDSTHQLQSIKVESLEHPTDHQSTDMSAPKDIVRSESIDLAENSSSEEENDEETDDDTPTPSKSNQQIRKHQLSEENQKLLNSIKVKCHVAGCETSLSNLYKVWEHLRQTHYLGQIPPLKCTECDETFENQRLLHLHCRKYYSFKCPICGKVKPKIAQLKNHVKYAHCERPFKCPKCEQTFCQQSALKIHMNTHSNKKQFVCNVCSKEFYSCYGLSLHSNSHKNIKELQCSICGRQLLSKSGLKRHIRLKACGRRNQIVSVENVEDVNVNESSGQETVVKMEPNSDDEDLSNEPEIESSIQIKMDPDLEIIDSRLKYPESQMDSDHHESSNQSENLDLDLRDIEEQEDQLEHSQATGEENADESDDYLSALSKSNYEFSDNTLELLDKCKVDCHYPNCDTKCTSLTEIWDHFKKEHFSDKKPYTCGKCSEQFDDKLTLRLHIKNYYSFKCPVCFKTKVNSGELKRHVLIAHSNERPYKCVKCTKTFSRLNYLKSHLISHNGKRNFVCNVCSKDFFSKAGLYSHVRCHKNLKELQCEICNKQFLSKYNLKKHLATICCRKTKE